MTPYYAADGVQLYLGDCLEVTEWLAADVLVTDPPYGINYTSGGMRNTHAQRQAYAHTRTAVTGDDDTALRDSAIQMWGSRPAVVFGSWRLPRPTGVRHRLVWHKTGRPPGISSAPWFPTDEEIYVIGDGFAGAPTPTVVITNEQRQGTSGLAARVGHPTPKPGELMEQLIAKCPPGVVADPFAGSGSTLVAARNLGRRAIGVEIEEKYCEVIARRLDQAVLPL